MRLVVVLLLLFMAANVRGAMTTTTAPAESTTTTAPAAPAIPDDFTPALGIFAALVVLVIFVAGLLLVGLALAAGLVIAAIAAVLAALGILSSSVVIGFLQRSPAAAVRALFLQAGALTGIPCGIAAIWLVSWLAQRHWDRVSMLMIGALGGLLGGLALALVFNYAWGRAGAWLLRRLAGR
jgi:hypothetical protein